MTALEIIQSLSARGAIPRLKDMQTSLRKLADAMQVPLENLDLATVKPTYQEMLKTYFAHLSPQPSPYTQRNTFQNLAQLYRAIDQAGILPSGASVKSPSMTAHQAYREAAQRTHYRARTNAHLSRYHIPRSQWPDDIRQAWEEYCANREYEIRESTLDLYERWIIPYVSYNLTFEQPPITRWDQLFEVARLNRFIRWHCARVDQAWVEVTGDRKRKTRITHTGAEAVNMMRMLANHFGRSEAKALTEFRKKLPSVEPWHQKTDPIHTITPAELEGVGLALLEEARQPLDSTTRCSYRKREERGQPCTSPGLFRAMACETGLMIRLWWRVPIRSRSMREMDIIPPVAGPHSTNARPRLYRDHQGVWQLRYQGEQLKIGERHGKTNEFHVPFPLELVPHLEEYLEKFRPLIPHAERDPHLFLSQRGKPLNQAQIWQRLSVTVYKHLRKRLYPHLLRTIWTDLYLLSSGGDIDTAAYMLNDNPMTVLWHYHELRAERQVVKAYAFNEQILNGTTP